MSTWQQDRTSDFVAMQEEWGVEMVQNGQPATCIKTPDVVDKFMREAAYLTDVRSTFDVSRADWIKLKLGSRSQFSCGGYSYEIIKFRDDAADPIVQFDGVRLK